MLDATGIPSPDQSIPDYPSLTGASLLPHLQPVLQRLMIDTKQSLRFGVSEAERPNIRLCIAGPGGAIPNLAAIVARQCGFPLSETGAPTTIEDCSSTTGAIAAVVAAATLTKGQLPAEARAAAGIARVRRALIYGAAAAVAIVGFEAVYARICASALEHRLTEITSRSEHEHGPEMLRERAIASRLLLSGAENRMATALGDSPDFASVLATLSECAPETVRLTGIEITSSPASAPGAAPAGGKCVVHGYVRLADSSDASGLIKQLVDRLTAVPLVADVHLGATNRGQNRGQDSQNFEITLRLVALPSPALPGPASVQAGSATNTPEAP
jgi:hypothetical protein